MERIQNGLKKLKSSVEQRKNNRFISGYFFWKNPIQIKLHTNYLICTVSPCFYFLCMLLPAARMFVRPPIFAAKFCVMRAPDRREERDRGEEG